MKSGFFGYSSNPPSSGDSIELDNKERNKILKEAKYVTDWIYEVIKKI